MTFEEKFATYARIVEARLKIVLPDEVAGNGASIESNLTQAMRYGVLNGGKRLRPFLVLEAAKLFGVDQDNAVNAAAAIECVHCYSLVHDDLPAMDDDDLRRGKPTVHKKFDEATGILVGDSLLALAFEIMARTDTHEDSEIRCALVSGLGHASGSRGMAGGQALDLAAEDVGSLGLDEILRIQSLKTGALIEFSLDAGAILGRASGEERAALCRFGRAIGLAFQIVDDLLDVEGDAEKIGKATGKDADLGKKTVLSHLGVDGARERLVELETEAARSLDIFGERASTLIEAARFIVRREY